MMKALLKVRFRALIAGMTAQGRQKKKRNTGFMILLAFAYVYIAVVMLGMMGFLFHTLAQPYHAAGLDWLYFAMAGLMALGFAVIGSVFTTQSQLYDAKDNPLLLSMPVKPGQILMSRMIPLLALNLLFGGLVFLPAIVIYAVEVRFALWMIPAQILALLGVCLLAQAMACVLGWGLHLLLSKMNKSFASVLYVVVFLSAYFYIYSKAGRMLNSLASAGAEIAGKVRSFIWPLYAMGVGCADNFFLLLPFAAICIAVFALAYWMLAKTFLRSALMQHSRKRKKLDLHEGKQSTPVHAIIYKEWHKFVGCPVYLTNMGMGVLMTAALPVVGLLFRGKILEMLAQIPFMQPYVGLMICAMLAFTVSTICISTPSVSLEGKSIWIMKSMPLTGWEILGAKLRHHMLLAVPVSAVSGWILAAAFGCGVWETLLIGIVPGLLAILNGYTGMAAGLKWARLDFISEAYPCKQSVAILVNMLGVMCMPYALGALYLIVLQSFMSPILFMAVCAVLLAALCVAFRSLVMTWGVRKWEAL